MCTRVFNNRNKAYLTTARNMDWNTQLPTSLFSYQSGLIKYALDKKQAKKKKFKNKNWKWTSKYSSLVTMVGNEDHGYAASDGINSQGLVANVLYAKGSDYELEKKKEYNPLNVLRWVQYVLDNFKTAKEVRNEFENGEVELVETKVPGSESTAALHLSVSDRKGYTTIVEVYGGKYHVHYGKEYSVMTNEPTYKIQLQLNKYWSWQWNDNNDFPSHTIPGGPFASDRFERASYYYNHLEAPINILESLSQAKSVVANASVPIGMLGFEGHPNIAPTLWSTLSDHKQLKYYFCNARTPNVVWVDMNGKLPAAKVSKLDLVTEHDGEFTNMKYVGCINNKLKATKDPYGPFKIKCKH
ncbi:linear amide C-N hydrolase [Kordia sp. YSTF-M3]|uniref:Linear amide C-N hydrolase n=1 Tax=Kordia aestuariivivens TaxID=2759037 RepID=A0ABR7QFC4_9FLAO|nr:linear amide C-N hydrolase [Kordia aestuariivivens]MBC8757252.1 linear amide C-N hydrolase [Kordia aestuariivivens]